MLRTAHTLDDTLTPGTQNMKTNPRSNFWNGLLLFSILLFVNSASAERMPSKIHKSLGKLIGTWEIETRVDDQVVSTVVTLKWSTDKNTIHYDAKGGNLATGVANTTFSGILGWDGSKGVVSEHSYTSLGETMSATHEITDGKWVSPTTSIAFIDGKPLTETKIRYFHWDAAGRLTIQVTKRKRGDESLPDQTYHFRRVAPGSNAVAIRLIKDTIGRWRAHWKSKNLDELAKEFAPNGVRVLGRRLQPSVGARAIRESFEPVESDSASQADTKLQAEVLHARFLDKQHIIGDGIFTVTDSDGKIVRKGKWANLFVINKKRTKVTLLMEAAFEELPLNAVAKRELPQAGLKLPSPVKLEDEQLAAMLHRSIQRYAYGAQNEDSNKIAREFTINGVRSVSEIAKTIRGRAAILKSLRIANEGSSPYAKTALSAVILGARRVSDRVAIAYGSWQVADEKGKVIDYGQWGNVFSIKDGEVKLLQESAGSYLP